MFRRLLLLLKREEGATTLETIALVAVVMILILAVLNFYEDSGRERTKSELNEGVNTQIVRWRNESGGGPFSDNRSDPGGQSGVNRDRERNWDRETNDRAGNTENTNNPLLLNNDQRALRIKEIKQVELSIFFSQYEDSDQIPDNVLKKYLIDPALMQTQIELTQMLVDRVRRGDAPLTPEAFYQLVLDKVGDPGTALILAHNITKALARGRSPMPWKKVKETPFTYDFNGVRYQFDPEQFHPNALPEGSRGQPSVFYAMFSPDVLGTHDEGDWYHYYLQAGAAYYGATGQIEFDDPLLAGPYSHAVDGAIDSTMNQMQSKDVADSPPYEGWRYANSLSFLEGAVYGSDYGGSQEETMRESNLHREGALFGLHLAGEKPNQSWRWYVPKSGVLGQNTRDIPLIQLSIPRLNVNIPSDMYSQLDPSGNSVSPTSP